MLCLTENLEFFLLFNVFASTRNKTLILSVPVFRMNNFISSHIDRTSSTSLLANSLPPSLYKTNVTLTVAYFPNKK